jgi:hypothetical protein
MSATGPGPTTPQERLRQWLDDTEDEPFRGTLIAVERTDLRDVLNELDEHQRLLEQIDEALDGPSEYGNIERIRALLGNHTEDNL